MVKTPKFPIQETQVWFLAGKLDPICWNEDPTQEKNKKGGGRVIIFPWMFYPFIHQWTLRLFLCLAFCKYCWIARLYFISSWLFMEPELQATWRQLLCLLWKPKLFKGVMEGRRGKCMSLRELRRGKFFGGSDQNSESFFGGTDLFSAHGSDIKRGETQRGCNCGHLWSTGSSCFTYISHTLSSAQPSNPGRPWGLR